MKRWEWNQKISEEINKEKYMLRGETIEQAFKEIAEMAASVEKEPWFGKKNK